MPTPESELFLKKKPTVPPTFEGVDFRDYNAVTNARDAIIREQWVKAMMQRLVEEELGMFSQPAQTEWAPELVPATTALRFIVFEPAPTNHHPEQVNATDEKESTTSRNAANTEVSGFLPPLSTASDDFVFRSLHPAPQRKQRERLPRPTAELRTGR